MGRPSNNTSTFLSRVLKTDSCWEWIHIKDSSGYGIFPFQYKTCLAHRVSYEMHKGPIPTGMYVCHSCDNRGCVNPDHLWLGSTQDNTQDKVNKNRQAMGEDNGQSKLSEQNVLDIRASNLSGPKLAKQYGVDKTTVYNIKKRLKWKHI